MDGGGDWTVIGEPFWPGEHIRFESRTADVFNWGGLKVGQSAPLPPT